MREIFKRQIESVKTQIRIKSSLIERESQGDIVTVGRVLSMCVLPVFDICFNWEAVIDMQICCIIRGWGILVSLWQFYFVWLINFNFCYMCNFSVVCFINCLCHVIHQERLNFQHILYGGCKVPVYSVLR